MKKSEKTEKERATAYEALGDRKIIVPIAEEMREAGITDEVAIERTRGRLEAMAAAQEMAPDLSDAELEEIGNKFDTENPPEAPEVGGQRPEVGAAEGRSSRSFPRAIEPPDVFGLIMRGFDLLREQTGHAKWPAWQQWEEEMNGAREYYEIDRS